MPCSKASEYCAKSLEDAVDDVSSESRVTGLRYGTRRRLAGGLPTLYISAVRICFKLCASANAAKDR